MGTKISRSGGEERSDQRERDPTICNVSGKKKGHLRGIWRTGGVRAGELPRATSCMGQF